MEKNLVKSNLLSLNGLIGEIEDASTEFFQNFISEMEIEEAANGSSDLDEDDERLANCKDEESFFAIYDQLSAKKQREVVEKRGGESNLLDLRAALKIRQYLQENGAAESLSQPDLGEFNAHQVARMKNSELLTALAYGDSPKIWEAIQQP